MMNTEKADEILSKNVVSFWVAGIEESLPIRKMKIGSVWAKLPRASEAEHLYTYGIQNEDGEIVSYIQELGGHECKIIEEFDELRETMNAIELIYKADS